MRIFTEKTLKEFVTKNPDALLPMQNWAEEVRKSQWTCFADIKKTFNSVDAIGSQRYVFNISGNHYRIVAVVKFTIGFVYIRFVGTHREYDRIDCLTI
ncbi:MAG: type II toxin-antitoxin system HigB family toxin [Prevotella sp.]|jgi:mRNA interferase HigB|nr:type II toxin-antitoxin system HigB family toxin [Prevotella sp.]